MGQGFLVIVPPRPTVYWIEWEKAGREKYGGPDFRLPLEFYEAGGMMGRVVSQERYRGKI